MVKRMIVRGATLFAMVGLATTTSVATVFSFPGVQCFPVNANSTDMSRFGGTVSNTNSTNSLDVICPIFRYNPQSGYANNSASFDVFDRNQSQDFTCRFCTELALPTGLQTSCGSLANTGPGFSQSGVKNITEATPPSRQGALEYAYVLCTIPAASTGGFSHLARISLDDPSI